MVKLFYASLERHMKKYMNDVELNQFNIEYQAMLNKLVRDGERMQLSQAEIQNKIEQFQKDLVDETINKKISITKTNAPRLKQAKVVNPNNVEVGQLLPDFPAEYTSVSSLPPAELNRILSKDRQDKINHILSLYKGHSTNAELVKALLNQIADSAVQTVQTTNKNKEINEAQLNAEFKRNLNELSKNPKVSANLHDELMRSIKNVQLKKTPVQVKDGQRPAQQEKKMSPFESELKSAIAFRAKKTAMLTEVFPEVNKRNVNQLLDNVITELINNGLKKAEVKKGAETVVDELLRNAADINSKEEINDAITSIIDTVVKNQFPSNTIGKTDNPMTLKSKLKADYKAAGIPLPSILKKKGSVKIEVLEQLRKKINK